MNPMSSNSTVFGRGVCPAPFLEESLFPTTGGAINGRFCSDLLGPACCLPCPQTEWLYPENFDSITHSAAWINVAGTACCVFLLASFAFLPVSKTHRHYLSVCLAIALILMHMGFIIPLAAKPDQCFNEITPNDMSSSRTCALSGAFLLAGGWSAVIWVFLRAVALHLQICWQFVIGKTFMYGAILSGWGIPAIALTFALIFSGVSFRFGDTCHINHQNSLADFWIPLLVFAALTVVIQFSTFGYCIKVYLASLADDSNTTESSGLPSYTNSFRGTVTPKQAYRRVRKVIELQWRGIAIVLLIVADVVFFAVVFVFMDDIEQKLLKDPTKSLKWLACLVENQGDKSKCVDLAATLVINEATIMAVLILLSINGIWALLLLGRLSMLSGWTHLLQRIFSRHPSPEFISADATLLPSTPGSYEMLNASSMRDPSLRDSSMRDSSLRDIKHPEPTITPLSDPAFMKTEKSDKETLDYFGREARYKSPSQSFSAPMRPKKGEGEMYEWGGQKGYYVDPLSMNKT